MTVAAIVLAGGRSSRFGESKLDAQPAGAAGLHPTIEAVQQVADEVLVVGRSGGPEARFLEDPTPFEGPLAGLAVGLAASSSSVALVVGGDMPLLHPGVLGLLLER